MNRTGNIQGVKARRLLDLMFIVYSCTSSSYRQKKSPSKISYWDFHLDINHGEVTEMQLGRWAKDSTWIQTFLALLAGLSCSVQDDLTLAGFTYLASTTVGIATAHEPTAHQSSQALCLPSIFSRTHLAKEAKQPRHETCLTLASALITGTRDWEMPLWFF